MQYDSLSHTNRVEKSIILTSRIIANALQSERGDVIRAMNDADDKYIYVCEEGCRYDGGSAFLATTSLIVAWKAMAKRRVEYEGGDGHTVRPISVDKRRDVGNRGKTIYMWQSDYDYFAIKRFINAVEVV